MDGYLPLSDEDIAILDLEGPEVAGHTLKVIRLGGTRITPEALRSSIATRLGSAPELTRVLADRQGKLCWRPDPEFDIGRHVTDLAGGEEIPEDGVRRTAAGLFAERLDRELPLWRIDVAALAGGGTALFWRIHHAMADGTTAMRLARQVLWDSAGTPEEQGAGQTGGAAGGRAGTAGPGPSQAEIQADHARRQRHILGLFEREFARSSSPSPFDGRIGTERAIAFATVPLGGLHDSAKVLAGATLNDAVLAVIGGALRHWMDFHGDLDADVIRVKVPVSLHRSGDGVANRESFFSLPLPLGEPDPLARLAVITAATGERKSDHDAEELDAMLRRLAHTSKRLGRVLTKLESSPRRFALNVSNVKGPRQPVSVLGSPVDSVHSVAEIARHHALRVAVLSVDDRLCFGFCADPHLVGDLDEMAAGAETEAGLLMALAAGSD